MDIPMQTGVPCNDIGIRRESSWCCNEERRPITAPHDPGRDAVIDLLNDALATEMVHVLRHRQFCLTARQISVQSLIGELLACSVEAQASADHVADKIAERIFQLGGELDFRPQTLTALCEFADASADPRMI